MKEYFTSLFMSTRKDINENRSVYRLLFVSTLIWGVLAHGFIMLNKIALHDESLELYGQDLNTISQGRWMQEILRKIELFCFEENRLSTTFLYALYAFIVCFFLASLFFRYFGIEGKVRLVALAGVIVSSPTILMCFGYSYFVPYYLTGFLFVLVGVFFSLQKKSWLSFAFSVIFFCLAMGVYQSWMTFGLSLIFLKFFNDVEKNEYKYIEYIKNGFYYLGIPVLASLFYFVINKIILTITHRQMTSYAGIDTMGVTTISGYWERIKNAYLWFINPPTSEMSAFFPLKSIWLYRGILLSAVVLFIYHLAKRFKEKRNIYQEIVLIIVFPAVIFSILVIGGAEYLTPLNLMTNITLIVFCMQQGNIADKKRSVIKCFRIIILALIVILDVFYVRFDNSNYLKAEMVQSEMREWFSGLVYQIKSVEGYDDELPVLYINEWEKKDLTLNENQAYHLTPIWPYALNEDYLLNDFAWRAFVKNHCGFNPKTIEIDDLIISEEDRRFIESMPSYPDDGSIKNMGDYIVVKY